MQLDSHRRQFSFTADQIHPIEPVVTVVEPNTLPSTTNTNTMPCPRSRCVKPITYTADDGTEMQAWHSVRREHLRNMRSMVKRVVFYMALIEAIRVGPDAMIFAGKNGYAEQGADDFGIAYYAGYVLSYIYLCIFTIVWTPLFSWWVPSTPADSSTGKKLDKFVSIMQQINMVLLPISVALSVGEYIFWTVMTIVYVDARPVDSWQLPKNTQKNWLARVMILVGIFVSMTFGYGVFEILGQAGLARVKCLEYMIIVVPIQLNIGVLLGSVLQWKMEKRVERKALVLKAMEPGTSDEKEALLAV